MYVIMKIKQMSWMGILKMQNNFNEIPVNNENSNLSTLMDLNSQNLNGKLNQAVNNLNRIINVTKQIQEERGKIKKNPNQGNGIVVHTGTDYHGDIICFMNGAVSEIVTWNEKKINVVDVSDGEILFSGTEEDILQNNSNMKSIINQLTDKYNDRQKKLQNLVYELVYFLVCAGMKQGRINFNFNDDLIKIDDVEINLVCSDDDKNLTSKINVQFNLKRLLESVVQDLSQSNWPTHPGTISEKIVSGMIDQIKAQFSNAKTFLDNRYTQTLRGTCTKALMDVLKTINKLGQYDIDFSLEKNFKVVLINECELKKDLDPNKDLVRLTGDYIDRGDSSSEIMCHIKNIHDKINAKAEQEKNLN